MKEINQGLNFRATHKEFDVDGLAKVLENEYLATRRISGYKKKESFAPSGVGYGNGTCPRYWWYAFNGAEFEETADASSTASMSYGTEAHVRIQNLFRTAGILREEELEIINESPPIRGYLDLVIDWQDDQLPVEIKTTRQEMFMYRQNTMKAPGYNLIQILIYMKVLNKDKGFLLYENKNTQDFLIIPVSMNERNKKIVDDLFDWMTKVHDNAMNGELPIRPFPTPKSKACKTCPVNKVCWADTAGTVELLPLEVPK